MKLLLVRHGETEFTEKGIVQGPRFDVPLIEKGKERIRDLLSSLPKQVDAIYSSPLKRAYQSAEIISDHLRMPILVREGLRETDYGTISGKTWDAIHQELNDDQIRNRVRTLTYNFHPWEGESIEDDQERIKKFIAFVQQEHEAKDVILGATHGGTMRVFYNVLNLDQPEHIEYGSLHEFSI